MLGEGKKVEPGKRILFPSFSGIEKKWLEERRFSGMAFFIIAALVFFADQLTKYWVTQRFVPGETWALLPNIFHLTYVRNPGAAFGILAHNTSFFIIATFLTILVIVFSGYFLDDRYALLRLALSLLLGGSSGNLADRLKTGYVIDFLDFRIWPVFNLADIALSLGVLILAICLLRPGLFPPYNKK